jgi:hypothetical protein
MAVPLQQVCCAFAEVNGYSEEQHAVAHLSASDSLMKQIKGFLPNSPRIRCSFELFDWSFVTQGCCAFAERSCYSEQHVVADLSASDSLIKHIKGFNRGCGIRFFSLQGFVHVKVLSNSFFIVGTIISPNLLMYPCPSSTGHRLQRTIQLQLHAESHCANSLAPRLHRCASISGLRTACSTAGKVLRTRFRHRSPVSWNALVAAVPLSGVRANWVRPVWFAPHRNP